MKRIYISLIALLFASPLWSENEYVRYDWESFRDLETLSPAEQKEGGVFMLDKRFIEVAFEGGSPVTFNSRHLIVRLNTDFAVESFNKVYVPMTNVISMVEFKARYISKDGKEHIMDVSKVKDVENYNNAGPYKIYALEGIEVGGEIEYMYTVKKNWRGFGTESFRSSYDYRKIEFDIITPDYIKYEGKSYNGLEQMEEVDYKGYDKKRQLSLRDNYVKGFEEEAYSFSNASYPRVEFKFAYNTGGGFGGRMNTWDDAANTFYEMIYSSSPNEKRMAHLLLKRMGFRNEMSTEEKIRLIEGYVKSNYALRYDAEGDLYETVAGVIKSKVATELGLMRLYAALFEQAKVEMRIVMTSDRFEKRFDGDFDSWAYLQYFLIYFPETNDYMAPGSEDSRYGYIPGALCGQDGLFIHKGDNGVAKKYGIIQWIRESEWSKNMNNLTVSISFDVNNGLANVKSTHQYLGHSASFLQPFVNYLSAEDRREEGESILAIGAGDARPRNVHITGFNGEDTLYRKPLTISGEFTTNSFLEKTCNNYIFKVGEVIGTQYNMYQKEERLTDIALVNPHGFVREINFEVPAGYKVTNLEALNIYVADDSLTPTMLFRSTYTQEGSSVKVLVEESYQRVTYDKERYEDFRKVMNASADFNKVVVIFEKI